MKEEGSLNDITGLTVPEIRKLAEESGIDDALLCLLESDSRAGVRSLAERLSRARARRKERLRRERELGRLENELRENGKELIAGVDEAGRGPLAGPVVAAAVILPAEAEIPGIDDSKKLSPKRREELFERITAEAAAWGIGMVDNVEIDNSNILDAAMKAMRTAVKNMKVRPDIALIDGNRSPGLACEELLLTDGDSRSRIIAAASILAKVTRDRIMTELDGVYPGYGFAGHKGYGARKHIEAIRELGPCDIHRISFRIVPGVAPRGTAAEILKRRMLDAPGREAFERVVAGIANMKEHLGEYDIEILRNVYRTCRKRFE